LTSFEPGVFKELKSLFSGIMVNLKMKFKTGALRTRNQNLAIV
jgi:hypothetical protein